MCIRYKMWSFSTKVSENVISEICVRLTVPSIPSGKLIESKSFKTIYCDCCLLSVRVLKKKIYFDAFQLDFFEEIHVYS